jgi:hypothetical protein
VPASIALIPGQRATRTLNELSKLSHPGVGVAPQPTFIRMPGFVTIRLAPPLLKNISPETAVYSGPERSLRPTPPLTGLCPPRGQVGGEPDVPDQPAFLSTSLMGLKDVDGLGRADAPVNA